MEPNTVLAEKLNTAWRFFYRRGFIDGFGHISARTADPGRILISPHSLGADSRPGDFVIIDLDGNPIGGDTALPGEWPIHTEIFRRRPDVGSVAHFHCLYSTSFGVSEHDLRPSYFLASIFRKGIPVHPDSRLVIDRGRGAALAETLGECRAALMKAHGIVVTGRDVEEMTAAVFIMEDNAHRTWISAAMGAVEFLRDEAMAENEKEFLATRGPFRRIWALCEAEAADEGGG